MNRPYGNIAAVSVTTRGIMETGDTEKRSLKPFIIAGGVLVALLVILAAVLVAVGTGDEKATKPAATTEEKKDSDSVSYEDIEQSVKEFDTSKEQAEDLLNDAKAARDDEKNQIKVGE